MTRLTEWKYENDVDGAGEQYEMVIPNDRLYTLWPVTGDDRTVSAQGKDHENVTWCLDYAEMIDGEVHDRRYVTTDEMDADAAKDWAVDVPWVGVG
jgi:hypothetical protein